MGASAKGDGGGGGGGGAGGGGGGVGGDSVLLNAVSALARRQTALEASFKKLPRLALYCPCCYFLSLTQGVSSAH